MPEHLLLNIYPLLKREAPLMEQLEQISKVVDAVNGLLKGQEVYLVVEVPDDPKAL